MPRELPPRGLLLEYALAFPLHIIRADQCRAGLVVGSRELLLLLDRRAVLDLLQILVHRELHGERDDFAGLHRQTFTSWCGHGLRPYRAGPRLAPTPGSTASVPALVGVSAPAGVS